jgi:regulator of nonsense transcripts 3
MLKNIISNFVYTVSLGQNAFSRAYLNIPNQQDIIIFMEKFDGYVFIDAKGKHEHMLLNNARKFAICLVIAISV